MRKGSREWGYAGKKSREGWVKGEVVEQGMDLSGKMATEVGRGYTYGRQGGKGGGEEENKIHE